MNPINPFAYRVELYLIMIVSLVFAITELRMYVKFIRMCKKILFAIIGLYWFGFYLLFLLDDLKLFRFDASGEYVRSGILFTLCVLCGLSLNKWWRLNRK